MAHHAVREAFVSRFDPDVASWFSMLATAGCTALHSKETSYMKSRHFG